jgi:F0F1-type ATP synthase assembly protein I
MDPRSGAHHAWSTLGYLIAGIGLWGSVGWLVDRWLSLGGVGTAVGTVVGAGGAIYLIVRRLGL